MAAKGRIQNEEQKVNTVNKGVKELSGGIKIFVRTTVKWTASIKSKKSRKFPIRTIETDFLISMGKTPG